MNIVINNIISIYGREVEKTALLSAGVDSVFLHSGNLGMHAFLLLMMTSNEKTSITIALSATHIDFSLELNC